MGRSSAASADMVRRLGGWSSPWASSRAHVAVALALAAASGIFAAYAQDAWRGWHFIGHSLVLWIIVATIAGVAGSWLQSWLTTAAALVVAVLCYFIAERAVGPFEYPPLFGPLLLFWMVLAVIGGAGFATICLTAVGRGRLSFLAVGTVAGLLLGDAINTSIGIPYVEQQEPFATLGSVMGSPDVVMVIALVAAGCWIVAMLVHHRRHLLRAWLIVPGALAGHVLVTVPDILLHYA